jgi:hypothetical protein
MSYFDPWMREAIEAAHRRGFAAGVIATGVLWILCTIWSR